MNNVVEFLATKQITKTVPIRDAYYFKPKGRFIWLQKLAWKFLFKRNSLFLATTVDVSYVRYTIDTADFIKRLFEQRQDLWLNFHKEPTRLLIGAQDFDQLMRTQYNNSMMHHIEFDAQYCKGTRNGEYKIFGLKVEVIPWMRGAVVMP